MQISGSKNASLPIIAASLLFKTATLHNVPRIGDVFTFLELIRTLGVKTDFTGNTLKLDTSGISTDSFNTELVKKIRVSLFVVPVLLYYFKKAVVPYPGGCNLGKRPIDAHLHAFESLGYEVEEKNGLFHFSGAPKTDSVEIFAHFSVMGTENAIIGSVTKPGKTVIRCAAIEPHVMDLVRFFTNAGVRITVDYDHTIIVEGGNLPERTEHTVIHDYLESGTFAIFGELLAKDYIDIKNARLHDLYFFLSILKETGVRFERLPNDTLRKSFPP